jgi:NAD(P)-dependent dehydrogenase (short-subunit alcohol dehydrogenase family)
MFPYAAAKSGVIGLTRSLALDMAKHQIRVNAVSPGWTRTWLVQEWFNKQPDPRAAEESVVGVHPLGRICEPSEVAEVVCFLASARASAITGAELSVDAGLSARFAT